MKENIIIKDKMGGLGIKGRYRIIATDSITGEVISTTPWINNLVMNGTFTGVNTVANRIIGVTTHDITITKAKIGTGTATPADSDTDLQTPVFTKNSIADGSVSGNIATLSIFMSDAELANGTYTEFGIFAGNDLFARSLIVPSYTKTTNQDSTFEYQLTVNN